MARILATATLAVAFCVNAELRSASTGTCPLAGCDDHDGHRAASALVLMQQVQPQHQEHMTKVLPVEAVATLAQKSESVTRSSSKKSTKNYRVATRLAKLRKQALENPTHHGHAVSMPSAQEPVLSMLQMSAKHRGMARLAYKAAPRTHTRLRGWTAPLDEAGYEAVASLKSDDDMEMFVRRVIDAYDCKIVNQASFMSTVPWFSGTTNVQSFEKLQETLLYQVLSPTGNPWLAYKNSDETTGTNAELSFMGYVEVAATRRQAEVVSFARRVCEKLGVQIVEESGLQDMLKRHSDPNMNYSKLEQEISNAADNAHSWAAWKIPRKPQHD